jgi:photosystem II stability/assembly factor-like uncharacterized protein
MRSPVHLVISLLALTPVLPVLAAGYDESLFHDMEWREIGPYRGGRSAAVAGIPGDRYTYYFGATGGGVWKTDDAGGSWMNVSDGFFGGSIGAVAVSEWDPNVVYVGGGEKTVRGNVSHGDGIWKSVDAGRSWTFVGLPESRHVPRIRIHPKDPDLVYAAVLGHLFGPNEERGVYRSRDGGGTWERVLFANADAGAVDLILDPSNPRVLYASTWRVRRTPWSLESGGEGSALWKSIDGGDSWEELSDNEGFPEGTLGIIGITVSPSDPENLYAMVEADQGGVYRSRDGGKTWAKTNEDRNLRQRAWYYTRIYADPAEADTVYVLNVRFWKSKDGGKSFESIAVPHGDNHDLWIAPEDPARMIEANDGGANVSFDGGTTWSPQDNQPTAQFYRVSLDDHVPFRLLGGQQDNSAVRILHRTRGRGIGARDWEPTAGGESGHIVAKPGEPDVVFGGSYGGFLLRVDHRTEEVRAVDVWPDNPMGWGAAELKYRFQWNFPISFSAHDPETLYAAANVLFRTRDGGERWEAVSPDLTRNDASKMGPSGGPITKDNTSVEYYGTIFAAVESPLRAGVLWTGSDDGLIHLSRDGGKSWEEVTPPAAPEWIQFNSLEGHPFEPGGLYAAGTMYKWDDLRPYLFKTTDWGESWTRIDDGIPAGELTRVVRADPERPGLLYAGTERGVHVSFDDGAHWQPLQLDLPIVPVTDLAVADGRLAAATQGRGFWMLDDLAPLRQLLPGLAQESVHLFAPPPAWRLDGSRVEEGAARGQNPAAGAVIDIYLRAPEVGTEVSLAFLDGEGAVLRELHGTYEGEKGDRDEGRTEEEGAVAGDAAAGEGDPEPDEGAETTTRLDEEENGEASSETELDALRAGHNRLTWDLRLADAEEFDGMILWGGGTEGPRVPPGSYQVRLTVGDVVLTQPLELRADPASASAAADLEEQFRFLREARDKLSQVHTEIRRIRDVRDQLDGLAKRLGADRREIRDTAEALDEAMTAVEEALYQTQNQSAQDPLNYPIRLNDKLAAVAGVVAVGDYAPTAQAWEVKGALEAAIDTELATLAEIWSERLPAFNTMVHEAGVPALTVEEE